MKWSTFRSAEDNAPVAHEGSWQDFCGLLTTRHTPPAAGRLAGEKKGMPSFAPAIFRDSSRRATENATTLHLLAFDIDNAIEEPTGEFWDPDKCTRPKLRKIPVQTLATWEEVSAVLTERGVLFQGYSSWSSTPEWPRFRVVVPLRAALTPEVWEAGTEVALKELGLDKWRQSIDIKALRDVARMYFLPGAPEGVDIHFFGSEGHGTPYWIDATQLDAISVAPLPKNAYARPKAQEEVDWIAYGIEMKGLRLRALLEALGCVVGRPRTLDDGAIKWRSTCPWGIEHSHGADSDDAVVIETAGKWPHWSCAHSGHAHLGLQSLLDLAIAQGLKLTDFAPSMETDAENLVASISSTSSNLDIRKALEAVAKAPKLLQGKYLQDIKRRTGIPLQDLRSEMAGLYPAGEPSKANLTADMGRRVAETMLDKYFAGGAHLIQGQDKSWWSYTGTHWRRMANDNALRNYLLQILMGFEIEKATESSVLDSAFKILSALQARDRDLLRLGSQQPRVVNCRNGELWIGDDGTPTLEQHRAESYLTYVLDVDYDPMASCPKFEAALLDTFANNEDPEEMVRHFGEFMGYTIQPRRDQKTWWLFQGSGDNGKTKVMQTVQKLINTGCILPLRIKDADKNEFARAALAGKLLLLDDDVDTGTVLPDGFLKQVSEDKLLSGRNLYQSQFEFISTVVPVLLCNNYPSCRDLSQATQKRAMIVPFMRKFDRSIPNPYPAIWATEMAGVLNWALAGYRRLMARGHFLEPKSCLMAKRKFLSAANSLVEFIESGCDKILAHSLPSTEFYGAFRQWCDREGHTYIPKKGDVERDLVSLGYDVAMDGHLKQKVVRGLKPYDAQSGML